jgi:hypothetical protein
LGASVSVEKVTIYNRPDCCMDRLSNSLVSLMDDQRATLKSYRIGDASGKAVFNLGVVRYVRVQLDGKQYLHMSEVQVFNQNGVNVALGKTATQSSTYSIDHASKAVNGILTDTTHTQLDQGEYHELQLHTPCIVYSIH